jgi:hypothetical protein
MPCAETRRVIGRASSVHRTCSSSSSSGMAPTDHDSLAHSLVPTVMSKAISLHPDRLVFDRTGPSSVVAYPHALPCLNPTICAVPWIIHSLQDSRVFHSDRLGRALFTADSVHNLRARRLRGYRLRLLSPCSTDRIALHKPATYEKFVRNDTLDASHLISSITYHH